MRTVVVLLLALGCCFASLKAARADWLDDAWSGKMTARHGTPAITVRPDGVSVVLPAAVLDQALAERGMTTAEALRAFLDRYSPQCSHVLDLHTARANLTVDLRILAAIPFDEASAQTADEVTAAMEGVAVPPRASEKGPAASRRAQVPRITQLFTTLPEHAHFSIDYAPETVVHCVVPADSIS
jgi:hypothetical protein